MALSKRILSIAQEIYNNNDEDFLFSILWTSSSYKDFSSNFIFCRSGKNDDTFVGQEIVKLLGISRSLNFKTKEE